MKKNYVSLVFALLCCVASVGSAMAMDLNPVGWSVGNRPECAPIYDICADFDGCIQVAKGAKATVVCDDKTVATGSLSASNYHGKDGDIGTAVIAFDEPLVLPTGQTYKVVIPAGAIMPDNDTAIVNNELSTTFAVPETFGLNTSFMANDTTIASASYMEFYFAVEVESVEGSEVLLLKDGEVISTMPCKAGWDWGLGFVILDFGNDMRFERGAHYSFVLPRGSVTALYRHDIVNEEVSISFTGDWVDTPAERPINYEWCSLLDDIWSWPERTLGEVSFYFRTPVALTDTAAVNLYTVEGRDLRLLKSAKPTVSRSDDGQWVVTADFGGVEVNYTQGFAIEIKNGSLYDSASTAVNTRSLSPFGGKATSIAAPDAQPAATPAIHTISGQRVTHPQRGHIYIMNGKKVLHK